MKAALLSIIVLWAALGWLRDQGQQHLRMMEREALQAYAEAQADSSDASPRMIIGGIAPKPRTQAAVIKHTVSIWLALIPALWFHGMLAALTLGVAWLAFRVEAL